MLNDYVRQNSDAPQSGAQVNPMDRRPSRFELPDSEEIP